MKTTSRGPGTAYEPRSPAPKPQPPTQNNPHPQALILDGKGASAEIRSRCAEEVEALRRKHTILPGLAVVRVGEDPASVQYAGRIVKSFEATGLTATVFELPERSSRAALQAEIHRINVLQEFAAM